MSNIQRRAILPIAAIVGAQLVNVVLSRPQPGQSSSCLQWASEAVANAEQRLTGSSAPPTATDGYFDVRLQRDVQFNAPTGVGDSARSDTPTVEHHDRVYTGQANPTGSSDLLRGMTEAQYQAKRRAIALGEAY